MIKKKIEEDYSIPVCIQTLKYEGHVLPDNASLEMMKIHLNDTFHIKYLSEGDCREIQRIVKWFVLIRDGLVAETPSRAKPLSAKLKGLIEFGTDESLLEDLTYKFFIPWQNARTHANHLYFVQCGGLQALMDVYASLHHNSWSNSLISQKNLEVNILAVLWNLAETFELRRLIISHNSGLKMCMASFLRNALGVIIEESLQYTIRNALGLLQK